MSRKSRIFFDALFVITIAVFLYVFISRMSCSVGMIDEVFNISVANQLAQGAKPFVECWDLYQTGALFLAPFLYIYKLIIGSTDGIILFSRYVFLFFNLVTVALSYLAFRRIIGKKAAILAGLFMLTFAPLSLYYPWYDSVGTNFMLIGLLLLVSGTQMQSKLYKNTAFICAGFIHACMSISYPQFVTIALVLFVCTVLYAVFVDKKYNMPVYYVIGACIVLAAVFVYILAVGKSNIMLFDSEKMKLITARSVKKTMNSYINDIKHASTATYKQLLPSLKLQLIPLCIYIVNRFAKKYLLNVINYLSIIICAYITASKLGHYSTIAFFFLIGCWFILLVWDLPRDKMKFGFKMMLFFAPAAILGYLMVSVTAAGADSKCMLGAYVAAMLSVVYMSVSLTGRPIYRFKTAQAEDGDVNLNPGPAALSRIKTFITSHEKQIKTFIICLVLVVAGACSIKIYNKVIFNSKLEVQKFDTVTPDGIYKGIKLTQTEIDKTEKYEEALKGAIKDGDETIMIANQNLIQGYLISGLKPATRGLWSIYVNNSFAGTKKYFEEVSGEPDIIVRSASDKDFNEEVTKFVSEKYTQVYADGYCVIFHKK